MNIYEAFPSKYLKAPDLGGKEYTLTIRTVLMESIVEGEQKPVVYFEGTEKGLVLNRTNVDNISIVYGEETDHWAGKQVILYPDTVLFQGRRTPCLRVRPVRQDGGNALGAQPNSAPTAPQPALGNGPQTMSQPLGKHPPAQQPVDHGLDDDIPF